MPAHLEHAPGTFAPETHRLGFAIAVAMLVGGQVLALVTGLSSGETEPAGWWGDIVLTSIVAYSLSVAAIGIGGLSLLRDLLKHPQMPAESR